MYSKNFYFSVLLIFCTALLISACAMNSQSVSGKSSDVKMKKAAEHPVDMGSKDCSECHSEMTPDLYKEWEKSLHGLAMVKCQVCHGSQDNFVVATPNETCRGCHAEEYSHNPKPEKSCSSCHLEHSFTFHK
ncbi:cytochrome c3 family protein [Flexistipes sp.]|uniref:cytochrome c3 family protein n=1 Tax=Flexistipes sp. TaxID=3088135 RepID=UPI002E1ADB7B|nr:cytochrome c3 family protein [Flexistipes sp.]